MGSSLLSFLPSALCSLKFIPLLSKNTPLMSTVVSPHISSMRSKGGYWRRPVSRTYMYNMDVGEHYYAPMTNYLEAERGTRGETPGALTFDERLSKSWLHGRRYEATEARERYARCSSAARDTETGGFMPSALRQARAASVDATASYAQASRAQSSATASRQQQVASSMSASRQQASSQQTELDEVMAATKRSRIRIEGYERELQQIIVLEDIIKKSKQVNALGGTGYISNITGSLLLKN